MDISVSELKSKMEDKEDFVLLDVRELYEYDEFNPGGRLIPLGELMSQLDTISVDKNKEIVVYCRSGNRSAMAKQILQQSGYTQVRNLLGGIMDWEASFGQSRP
ncbi:MAG: rhodanese-like domain-containing protein [Saprospiraceae bacterium]|nr:rhodanese-like domain-containing protein [Saprospiraceae bacterium]